MGNHRLTDLEPASWIRKGVRPLQPAASSDWTGNTIGHCLPLLFDAYAKVLHPIHEDLDIENRSLAWNDVDGERNHVNPPAEMQNLLKDSKLVYVAGKEPTNRKRICWRNLAARYNIQFGPAINAHSFTANFPGGSWPRYLIGPDEGGLDGESLVSLLTNVCRYAEGIDCYFMYDLIATVKYEEDLLYRAKLPEIADVLTEVQELAWGTPTYWWPADRTWCVCSDWDLTFTLVGGSRRLIDDLLADDVLECIEAAPDTRIDHKADAANLDRKTRG